VGRFWPVWFALVALGCSKNKLGLDGKDRAPVVEIVEPNGEGTLYSDIPVDVSITAIDVEDSVGDFEIEWSSDVQGRLTVGMDVTGETSLAGAVRLDAGLHLLKVSVRDSGGNLATDEVIAEVGPPNEAPSCAIVSPIDGAVGNPGEMVSLTASISDPNEPAEGLHAEWGSTVDGTLGSSAVSSDGSAVFPINTLSPGSHTIQLLVRDELDAICTDLVVYTVGGGPEITILSPVDDAVIDEGQPVEFAGHVSDSIDPASDLRIQWRSDADGLLNELPPDSDGTMDFQIDDLSVGFHTITLFAINTEGMSNDETVTLRINGVPTQPSVVIEPESPNSSHDLTATLTSLSTDADGDPIDYRFSWYRNGELFLDGSSATIPKDSTTKGDAWRVVVTPSDTLTDGTPGEAEVFVSNTPPQLLDVSLTPDPASTSDDFVCTPSGSSDWDGDAVTLAHSWTVGGEVLPVTTATLASDWTARGQEVYCEVTPHDGFLYGDAVRSNVVTIANSAPHIVTAWINPEAVRAGDTPACEWGGFSDPDGDDDESTVMWFVNGEPAGTGTHASGAYVRGDTLTCTVTPSDGSLLGDAVSATVVVLNSAPSYESVEMFPRPAEVGDTIHCTGWGYYDPDGDTDSSYIMWDINGGVWGISGSITDAFSGGDVVTCTLIAYDGYEEGSAISQTQTIGNSPPSIDSVSITPESPSASDTLFCSHEGWSDVDGDEDATWYSWYRNDIELEVYNYWLSASYTEPGDVIGCRAAPWDGTSGGTPIMTYVTIENAVPSVTGANFSPSVVRTDDWLRIMATASDPDGDLVTLSYQWAVNGIPVGGDSEWLDGGSHFGKDDSITVTITPSDSETGEPFEAGPLVVLNSAPEGTVAAIDPEAPEEGEHDLVCIVTEDASDPDGDPVVYSMAWFRDGTPHTSGVSTTTVTGDTVDAAETAGGEEWTCTVTATDVDGDSASVDATAFVSGWVGRTADLPALSCAEVLGHYPTAPDGLYFLRPMDETFQAYCDMSTDGGGWTLVAFAPTNFGAPSDWSHGTALDREGCVFMSAFCRMSDDEINTILDVGSGTDDRLRLVAPGLPHHGRYYWDTPLSFYTTTPPSTSSWWSAATSLGGAHSPGCAPSDARGFGHEPTAGGCSAIDGFDSASTDRVYFVSSDGLSVGGTVDTYYSWYAQ
jgi:hypothetical protein